MLQWSTTEQQSVNNGVKILIYAPSGMGKTVLNATLPAPVILSAEAGLLSLSKKNLERMFGVDNPAISYNIPVINIKTVEDLTEAYDWLLQSAEARQFQSVGLDSISEIAEVVLANAKRQVKDPRQAYGELNEKLTTAIRAFRDLPGKHVYFSAKQGEVKDELSGIVKYSASMPGKTVSQGLPYFFDEVFRLGKNKDAQGAEFRFLQTQPDIQHEAKDRSGALDVLEYPHLGSIINKIISSN